jgi:hypothetical protein
VPAIAGSTRLTNQMPAVANVIPNVFAVNSCISPPGDIPSYTQVGDSKSGYDSKDQKNYTQYKKTLPPTDINIKQTKKQIVLQTKNDEPGKG